MPVFSTAGSKVYIGGPLPSTVADMVAADFTSQTWVPIGNLESIGSFGDSATSIDATYIDRNRKVKMKGTRDAGDLELVMGLDFTNAGQLAILAAERTPYEYAFKVEFNDKPSTGASPKNSTRQFVAIVMSAAEQLDDADNIMKLTSTLAINSNIVKVNASAS